MKSYKVKHGLLSITICTLLLSTQTQADQTNVRLAAIDAVKENSTSDMNSAEHEENSASKQKNEEKVVLPKQATGGVSLGTTRVVYPLNTKQYSVSITNHSPADRFLLNSWIEDLEGNKAKEFLVTPPLFVAEANSENTLRIIAVDLTALPEDRESVYWLNVKSIPSANREKLENTNVLQLAVQSRIKIFVRPKKLQLNTVAIEKQLHFKRSASGIEINNDSPYFASITNITLDGKALEGTMVAPLSTLELTKQAGQKISYQIINDFGGLSPIQEANLN